MMGKPPIQSLYRGVGTEVVVEAWNGDRAYLASDHYPALPQQRWGYDVYRVPFEIQGTILVTLFLLYFVPDEQISALQHDRIFG